MCILVLITYEYHNARLKKRKNVYRNRVTDYSHFNSRNHSKKGKQNLVQRKLLKLLKKVTKVTKFTKESY